MRRNAGAAFLWMVLALLGIIGVWALHRAFTTASLTSDARAMTEARTCELVAESAIEEMEAELALAANDFTAPLAGELRANRGPRDLSRRVRTPALDALLASPDHAGYRLLERTCDIVLERPIDGSPCEREALVVSSAAVSGPGTIRPVRRRVEVARWLKTTLVTVPRPFAQYGVFVLDAAGLTDVAQVNQLRERTAGLAREARDALAAAAASAPEPVRAAWQSLASGAFDPDKAGALPDPLALPPGSMLYGVGWAGDHEPLAPLDLARTLGDLATQATMASVKLRGAAGRASGAAPAEQAALIAQARDLAAAVVAPLRALWAFHATFRVEPPGSAAWNTLSAAMTPLHPALVRHRAHYWIEPGRDVQARFDRLVESGVNGTVWVDNDAGPALKLRGALRGKLVISVGGAGVELADVGSPGADGALVTVHVRGGPVRVAGACRASIVIVPGVNGQRPGLVMEPGSTLQGSLVLAAPLSGVRWDGAVTADEAQSSGFQAPDGTDHPEPASLFVALSPQIHYRRVGAP